MGKHILINNVRCSFPQLYKVDVKESGQKFNPGITVLLDQKEHAASIAELTAEVKAVIAGNTTLAKKPPVGEKVCLRSSKSDGWRDEYPEGHLLLKAGNTKPPVVLHKDMTRMTEADDKIYSGCRVNIKVELWGQNNQYGKRVNAKLLAVQFAGDDESFDGSYVSEETAAEGFAASTEDGGAEGMGATPEAPEGDTFLD